MKSFYNPMYEHRVNVRNKAPIISNIAIHAGNMSGGKEEKYQILQSFMFKIASARTYVYNVDCECKLYYPLKLIVLLPLHYSILSAHQSHFPARIPNQ